MTTPSTHPPDVSSTKAIGDLRGERKSLTLDQLAQLVGGELRPLLSEPKCPTDFNALGETLVHDALPPGEAGPNDVTMLDQMGHQASVWKTQAVAVLTPAPLEAPTAPLEAARKTCSAEENEANGRVIGGRGPLAQIIVDDPHAALTQVVTYFRPPISEEVVAAGIDSTASVDPTAQVHPKATVGAGSIVGPGCRIHANVSVAAGCVLGANVVLHPGVTLYPYTQLGDRVVLHAGCVVGANGFGYRLVDGRHVPTAQLGFVKIDQDVEVGACTTIDRGTYGATRIGEGTKIDNQVMIGHNCQIGRFNLLCSQVGIAGSCATGDYVVMAGQVGLKDHVSLGDGAVVGAQAGVMDDLAGEQVYLGSPATTQREQMQIMAVERRLPEMRRDLRRLEKTVSELTADRDRRSDREADASGVQREAA